ncbi:MAG: aminotransferase class I/II-fold pyridoxal phosphate-dependent enzyme [Lachnospiraceae bacterium]|nr:aminotransferase class I/II-fold pyridoxal phosphate-dependent enzyme [Lachnospiraceae bacterium]
MLKDRSREELKELYAGLRARYEELKAQGLKLDISRGKPSKEQLELSMDLFTVLTPSSDMISEDGVDTRNYGCLTGILEAKRLLADLLEAKPENIIVFGGSSLNIMYDMVSKAYTHGIMGETPWGKLPSVKFLCPVPGYDRHFSVTQAFGIEMINVPMNDAGPDMDLVERLVSEDESVKGIWCVPKYSNPGGTVYSDETVRRFAALKPAAKDFRIFWDNAYNVHHLDVDRPREILNILEETEKAGNPDLVYEFGSFSKITFPGSSVSAIACSEANVKDITSVMQNQIIGHNKITQLQHARYFKDKAGILDHMRKHAAILKPKFDIVEETLEKNLGGLGIGSWSHPEGGYFVSFNTLPGCAKKVVSLMKEAGVTMTGAGATYPYKKDPEDSNIRIAPSYATVEELKKAIEIFTLVVRLVSTEKLLEN